MVNVPPIPPLLCSTPPPIDFGEDDEDIDILSPALDGVGDDDFGNFLTMEDDTKSNESLPSPRTPLTCGLSPVRIFDGLIPSDEEEDSRNTTLSSPSLTDDQIRASNCSKKSKEIAEAFNFVVKNNQEKTKQNMQEENKNSPVELIETESEKLQRNSDIVCPEVEATSLNKNINHLTIETTLNSYAAKSNSSNLMNIGDIQNVCIEDIEDDLSDDELYSPKTPENFIKTENSNDYFKIEEIETTYNTRKEMKSNHEDVDTKSIESLDNNQSASLENGNEIEFKSFSSNSFEQNDFDMPPPLEDDSNSLDDEFGDFGDFQDFDTAATKTPGETQAIENKTVPVTDINSKQHISNLEFNTLNDLHKSPLKTADQEKENFVPVIQTNEDPEPYYIKDEFKEYTSHAESTVDSKVEETSKKESIDIKIRSKENSNKELEDFQKPFNVKEDTSSIEKKSNLCNSFVAADTSESDNFGNFAEFSLTSYNLENKTTEKSNMVEQPTTITEGSGSKDDDEFDDFADFKSHPVKPQSQEIPFNGTLVFTTEKQNSVQENNNDDDDDDDFGDFRTAQPTATASNITRTKTSQNEISPASQVLPLNNLNDRITKVLKLMFMPTVDTAEETADKPKSHKIQDIPFTSIDAAKALEYQWLNSDTRHSFIRSLGIDSRNILFGENWNPTLPRFAANLSFNPLKPMKPVPPSSVTSEARSVLEPIPVNSESMAKEINVLVDAKKEQLNLNCKTPSTDEQTTEAFKDNNLTPAITSSEISMSYVAHRSHLTEPVELTIFENEEKFSKTPPISEMESVTEFTSSMPNATMDGEVPPIRLANSLDDFSLKEVEENLRNSPNINEVVVTSTFSGSFKETHIYTPSKSNENESKQTTLALSSSPTKTTHIDFDYEKAAMGVIIDETVVKKEYRDVEYNPPFTIESLTKTVTTKTNSFEPHPYVNASVSTDMPGASDGKMSLQSLTVEEEQDANDDFSDFQSVLSADTVSNSAASIKLSAAVTNHGGMILSPAILIPQAISLENHKPKIEWGDSTATINPEELARIDELFPEPRSLKSSNGSNSSQKSTPTHHKISTPSISATVANKELEININNVNDDDDDWSDFVSVTVTSNAPTNRIASNNNILCKSPASSPFKQISPQVTQRIPQTSPHNNSNNDDEWSDFVSSAPPSQQPTSNTVPQFNSGAWQNANFYNNPLSMYHKRPINLPAGTTTHPSQKSVYNNNNNYCISQHSYQSANKIPPVMMGNNQLPHVNAYQQPQQVHVMQNFSTAPVPTPERLTAAVAASAGGKQSQFQSIGSAKVAPSIALIPDLGFVAPAIPTHTLFINSLPKPSINAKK